MATKPITCDCGHLSRPHGIWVGYATRVNKKTGAETTYCPDCAAEGEREHMRKTGHCFAYHTEVKGGAPQVTTWPGNRLDEGVRVLSVGTDNFGGERTYLRFRFEGEIWSGFSMGPGMYLRARRTKIQHLWD